MEYKRLLVGAASILALASGGTASASLGPVAIPNPVSPDNGAIARLPTDPLVRLLMATGGVFTAETIRASIDDVFRSSSADEIQAIPGFAASLVGLGVSEEVANTAIASLTDIVDQSGLGLDLKAEIISSMKAALHPTSYRLAAMTKDGRCDPRFQKAFQEDDPDCPPSITGAINGGSPY